MSFLNGMISKERRILDVMAKGSILDCYLEDVWDLIYQRAAYTRPYEFSELVHDVHKEDTIQSEPLRKEPMQPTSDIHVLPHEQLPLVTSDTHERISEHEELSPQATPHTLIDYEVIQPPSDQVYGEEEEYVQNDASLTVITECNDDLDVHAKKLISSRRPYIITPGSIVSNCTNDSVIIPNTPLSSHAQDHRLQITYSNKKVFGLVERVSGETPYARGWKPTSNYGRTFHNMRRNWKSHMKAKGTTTCGKFSLFFIPEQRRDSTFGWKPGWNSYGSAYGATNKRVGRSCLKFDGVHPWAPNI